PPPSLSSGGSRMSARLKFRLSAPAMAVSCLPLVVGLLAAWHVQRSQHSASAAMALNVRSVRAAEELAIGIRDLRHHLDRFLLTDAAAQLAEARALRQEMARWRAQARRAAVTPREQELIGRLAAGYGRLFDGVARLERVEPAGRPAAVR